MRSLLFDFGGTLDGPLHWLDRFLKHYQACGLAIARKELEPAFDAATRTAYRQSARMQHYTLLDLVTHLVTYQLDFLVNNDRQYEGFASNTRGELAACISDRFVGESRIDLERNLNLLRPLAQQFTIGIVSNFYGNLSVVLADAGFEHAVTAVADSGRLGVYKPDLEIYRQALAMMSNSASETLMIGDSLTKDCRPARKLGMKTVWFRPEPHLDANDSGGAADFVISSLDELPDLLCRIH